MNKIYFFTDKEAEFGVFVGAKTWKEARKIALSCEEVDCDFIDIEGHICKEGKKPILTDINGKLDCEDILKSGYEGFYWEYGKCDKCGLEDCRTYPYERKMMICLECQKELWSSTKHED